MSLEELLTGKSVVLVAPSSSLDGKGRGSYIDSFDVVVRLNWGAQIPQEAHADHGSRTDILYKRLLKLGKLDFPELEEFKVAGVKHIVAVERAANKDTPNLLHFRQVVGDSIPWDLAGDVRAELRMATDTSPLIGLIAVAHMLRYPLANLTLVGFDFYNTGYPEWYGGKNYRQAMRRQEGKIGPTHNAPKQIRYLAQLKHRESRLRFDATLSSITWEYERRRLASGVAIIIPARAASGRFPNKPLAPILGKPMILHVCDRVKVLGCPVFVATDSREIADIVEAAGFKVILTGEALTGTDRVALASERFADKFRTIVNVQGDEPLIDPASILALLQERIHKPTSVIGAVTALTRDPKDRSVVKVAFDQNTRRMHWASREPISDWQQVGLYAYSPAELKRFVKAGKKWPLEAREDIEILRFLQLGIPVHMAVVDEPGMAVDLPEHIKMVEEKITNG